MTNTKPTIAVDAMGGDFGPVVVVPGAVAAASDVGCNLVFTGNEKQIQTELSKLAAPHASIRIVHTDEVAGMGEKPSDVLRKKKNTSIQAACRLVRDGEAQGVVSAGNSGVTVACGMFGMGRIEGVDRPGLASIMPTEKGAMVLIDVGANVDCKPLHLFQFGVMADVLAKDLLGVANPRIGLLSIGEEEGKGNIQVREAFELLKKSSLNFTGNVEGRNLFTGVVDVVVCDGFVGNVALKMSEGLGSSFARVLKRELNRRLTSRIGTVLAKSAFRRFARLMDYAEYGGAPLLGLQGIAIICHGASNPRALTNAVEMATAFTLKKTNEHLIQMLTANRELTRFAKTAARHES